MVRKALIALVSKSLQTKLLWPIAKQYQFPKNRTNHYGVIDSHTNFLLLEYSNTALLPTNIYSTVVKDCQHNGVNKKIDTHQYMEYAHT